MHPTPKARENETPGEKTQKQELGAGWREPKIFCADEDSVFQYRSHHA